MAGGAAAAGGGGGAGEAAAAAEGVLGRARASGGCPRATLGLPGAGGAGAAAVTPAAARAAFRRLALALHPDKAKGAPGAEEAFKVANAALGRLLRQIQREEWDAAREARAAARAEAYAGSTAASAAPGVSEAAVRAAKEAWGGGGGGGGGGGRRLPLTADRPLRRLGERRRRGAVGGRRRGILGSAAGLEAGVKERRMTRGVSSRSLPGSRTISRINPRAGRRGGASSKVAGRARPGRGVATWGLGGPRGSHWDTDETGLQRKPKS